MLVLVLAKYVSSSFGMSWDFVAKLVPNSLRDVVAKSGDQGGQNHAGAESQDLQHHKPERMF